MSQAPNMITGIILQLLGWNVIAAVASMILIFLTVRLAAEVIFRPEPSRAHWISLPLLPQLIIAAGFIASIVICAISTGTTALLAGSFGAFCLTVNVVSIWSRR
jgi:hypothetical protein